jgi:hypothetical protein
MKYALATLIFMAAGGMMFSAAKLRAQSACGDPFEGAEVRFPTSGWITDFCQHDVPYSEIRSGGVPRDGIPPIYSPLFESVEAASEWLQPQSPVIALALDGEARAYPLAILTWHEIANDTVGDVPIAVTYCPLCNASIVFDRRVNGQVRTFGVSGNLRNSDLIMWDHETESWWQQFTGEGIVGAHVDDQLTMLPSQIVSFGDFAAQYPDGIVLSRETGNERAYGSNPYTGYDSAEQPFLFEGEIDPRLPAAERVLAGMIGDEAVAYPFSVLAEQRVINDTVGGVPVVALWQGGVTSALDAATIDESRDIGTAALYRRDLDERILTFSADSDGVIHDAETGSSWNLFGQATDGELAGSQLALQLAAPHLWFAWAAFRPETRIYELES